VRAYRRPALFTALVANAMEWYDFSVYGALASVLAVAMLPPGQTSAGLVGIFAVSPRPSWRGPSARYWSGCARTEWDGDA
jgi:hypothetical protein